MIMRFALLYSLIFSFSANAAYERALGKSARGLLMGDAFTTLATGDRTLFYNPALLARHQGFSFYPLNPIISGPNILNEPDRFSNLGGDPVGFADALFDFPVHLGLDYAPGFKMGRFGLSAIMNYDSNFVLQNQVTPSLDIDHRFDKGFIAGYGHNITNEISVGASIKYIKRESIYGSYNLTGYTLLDSLNAGEISDVLNALGKIQGSGWGFDAGINFMSGTEGKSFSMGLVAKDIYTVMHTEENTDDLEVQDQPMVIDFGSSWTAAAAGGFDLTLAADIKNLQTEMEFMRRIHLGIEVGLSSAITLLAGVSAVDNYSYGMQLNIGIIDVYIGAFSREIGERLQQRQSDEILLYFSLFDFTFDV